MLQDLIQTVDNWRTETPAAILIALTSPDPVRLPVERARHTAASLAEMFGSAKAEAMVATLKGAGLPVMADSLVARGLDFGNPELQGMIDTLAVANPTDFDAATVTTLKRLGVDDRPRWEKADLSQAPTEAEITTERQAIFDQEALRAQEEADSYQRHILTEKAHQYFNSHVASFVDGTDANSTNADLATAFRAAATAIENE